jgi:tRNA dimethylallyltransferase
MSAKDKKYLLVLSGPTGVGKTELSIKLAKHFNTSIISADSRQFYREMEIGTAKPTSVQLHEVKHAFVNSLSIKDAFDAGIYEDQAIEHLTRIFVKKPIALMVGGSGLYIKAVCDGFDQFPLADKLIRDKWISLHKAKGLIHLQDKIKALDPEYASVVDIMNPARLIRALTVIEQSGQSYSSFLNKEKRKRNFMCIKFYMNRPRQELYDRIDNRVDRMMESGLLKEAELLFKFKDLNALQTVGYRELFQYLEGEMALTQAIEKIKQHSRNYAKRQLTWLRNEGGWHEFHPEEVDQIIEWIETEME